MFFITDGFSRFQIKKNTSLPQTETDNQSDGSGNTVCHRLSLIYLKDKPVVTKAAETKKNEKYFTIYIN